MRDHICHCGTVCRGTRQCHNCREHRRKTMGVFELLHAVHREPVEFELYRKNLIDKGLIDSSGNSLVGGLR